MIDLVDLSVGDTVRIVATWAPGSLKEPFGAMDKWLGEIMTVREVQQNWALMYEDQDEHFRNGWSWYPDMIAEIVEKQDDVLDGFAIGDLVGFLNESE